MVERANWQPSQLEVSTLGTRRINSPLARSTKPGTGLANFVPDEMRVLYEPRFCPGDELNMLSFERAGARKKIFFDPTNTKAAIVTCGGLCPGINNVIRSLVFELTFNYGVKQIAGIRYGFQGFHPEHGPSPIELTPERVEGIHHQGGTILGTSRGHQEMSLIVDSLVRQGINILFSIGGDGTQRGNHKIAKEIAKRKLPIAIVGIPKTIDNDIKFCYRTFGFYTAVSEAEKVVDCAHVEAKGVLGGVGLVKFMGREAGFIAAAATLASGEANFTLIPEVPFELHGPQGFLASLRRRLEARQHAVVVVAEGAGQHLLPNHDEQFDGRSSNTLEKHRCRSA